VDGAQADFAGCSGMSAPAIRAKAQKQGQLHEKAGNSARFSTLISRCEEVRINSRFRVGCADLP
jgi:hypothetical protein